ncbi:glycosyltransferase family 9 protein, partial [Vibrio parahaemolyticus]
MNASTSFARRLRAGRFDVALVVNRSFRSALTARLADIRVRCGHSVERRGMLLTHPVRYDWKKNEAECYLDLGRALGLDMPSIEPK